jgi:hypothetical protein
MYDKSFFIDATSYIFIFLMISTTDLLHPSPAPDFTTFPGISIFLNVQGSALLKYVLQMQHFTSFFPKFQSSILAKSTIVRVIKSRMRWARHMARMGRGEVCTWFWWEKPEGKRPLRRPRRRWEDNIKMNLQ